MDSAVNSGSPTARRRILVVEDEFLIRMLLEDMLTDLGYELVGVAGRVDEAAEMARAHIAQVAPEADEITAAFACRWPGTGSATGRGP